jgi:hypothetical protein
MRFAFVIILLAVAAGACSGTSGDDRKIAAIVDEVAALAIEDGNIQGLVVAVAQNGSVAFERG